MESARNGSGNGNENGCGGAGDTGAPGGPVLAEDQRWVHDLWAAAFCALNLFVLLHVVDLCAGELGAGRSALWTALSLTLFVVLFPPRVTAGRNWLCVRGLFRERRVSTDLLTQVARREGVSQRIVLRDARGGRVELDPTTLTGNPLLWHELDLGARKARQSGLLGTGSAVLQRLADRVARLESDAARAVFDASGLR
ncbi:hypothetical protein [Streptomyces clavuligerus]|nr:hypothetical protein [Streptomyces clavuligerus]ANW20301.1 hypothetical protein BB341_19850 [Streptomyces clavuligerus]AXU14927.1 hypothetical protein D1794_20675 [Streptomyces clavuligerus]EDY48554.1 hypothetical protein SSCG_01582 [Streptomyces clavuligerus]MBY6304973.1 hypothetical protein [Streptomyces clavuligerus]QCS07699.1 hypothetical protein CRV15_20040 [Streptomyces clavuligerus]